MDCIELIANEPEPCEITLGNALNKLKFGIFMYYEVISENVGTFPYL